MDRVKRIWYLSPMRAAEVQASLRIRGVSPEPPLLAHKSSESRGTFRQKARSLAPLNGWACAVKICHDGMLEDTNSLDGAHIIITTRSILEKCDSNWMYTDIYLYAFFNEAFLIKGNHVLASCGTSCILSRARIWSNVSIDGDNPPCKQKIWNKKINLIHYY